MVFIFAFFGFLLGFAFSLGFANVKLRNKTKEQIQTETSLRWTYGIGIWLVGLTGGALGVWIHNHFYI